MSHAHCKRSLAGVSELKTNLHFVASILTLTALWMQGFVLPHLLVPVHHVCKLPESLFHTDLPLCMFTHVPSRCNRILLSHLSLSVCFHKLGAQHCVKLLALFIRASPKQWCGGGLQGLNARDIFRKSAALYALIFFLLLLLPVYIWVGGGWISSGNRCKVSGASPVPSCTMLLSALLSALRSRLSLTQQDPFYCPLVEHYKKQRLVSGPNPVPLDCLFRSLSAALSFRRTQGSVSRACCPGPLLRTSCVFGL